MDSICYRNLVYNGSFLYFSNQRRSGAYIDYKHPDGWQYQNSGKCGKITYHEGRCRIVVNSDGETMILKQALHEFPLWKSHLLGKTVSIRAHFYLVSQCQVSFKLSDGIAEIARTINISEKKAAITTKGESQIVDLKMKINPSAKFLSFELRSNSRGGIIDIEKVYANLGPEPIETLPLMVNGIIGERKQYIATEVPPAGELSLCNEPRELGEEYSRLDSVINKRFGTGPNGRSLLVDFRGRFSRAWSNGSRVDPDAGDRTSQKGGQIKGDHAGTFQGDQFLSHNHDLRFLSGQPTQPGNGGVLLGTNKSNQSKTGKTGGNETRPKNISELYTIKWA